MRFGRQLVGIVDARATRRPAGYHEEVRRKTPRAYRFEQAILQHEVLGVCPIVWQLGLRVITHDRRLMPPYDARRNIRWAAAGFWSAAHRADEAIHFPAVDVGVRSFGAVGTAGVFVAGVVIRLDARSSLRIGNADSRDAVAHWDAVGAGKRAEITIERPVLLHHDDHVLYLVNAVRRRGSGCVNVKRRYQRCDGRCNEETPRCRCVIHGGASPPSACRLAQASYMPRRCAVLACSCPSLFRPNR